MVYLDLMESAWSSEERDKVNVNWTRIMRGFSLVNEKIRYLSGGEEIEDIINRVNAAVAAAQSATTDSRAVLVEVSNALSQLTTVINNATVATASANTATNAANTATNQANQAKDAANSAASQANQATANANAATNAANAATSQANQAKDAANSAAINADNAATQALLIIQDMQDAIADLAEFKNSFVHRGPYSAGTQYYKNNETEHFGHTWRAKENTLGIDPPQQWNTPSATWTLIARAGQDANVSEVVGIWRGPTAPINGMKLWFKDTSVTNGYVAYVELSELPPLLGQNLWLRKRVV